METENVPKPSQFSEKKPIEEEIHGNNLILITKSNPTR